jgi:hypothetical protein
MMKFLALMLVAACSTTTPESNDGEIVVIADPDVMRTDFRGLQRWVDSRYNVVCYARYNNTLECFPISDEGNVQYRLENVVHSSL